MVAVLPLLLYPALGIGMAHMTATFSEQTRTVVDARCRRSAGPAAAGSAARTARASSHNGSLRRMTRTSCGSSPIATLGSDVAKSLTPDEQSFLEEAAGCRSHIEELGRWPVAVSCSEAQLSAEAAHGRAVARIAIALTPGGATQARRRPLVSHRARQVLIVIPRQFRQQLEAINAGLLQRQSVDASNRKLRPPRHPAEQRRREIADRLPPRA